MVADLGDHPRLRRLNAAPPINPFGQPIAKGHSEEEQRGWILPSHGGVCLTIAHRVWRWRAYPGCRKSPAVVSFVFASGGCPVCWLVAEAKLWPPPHQSPLATGLLVNNYDSGQDAFLHALTREDPADYLTWLTS